MTTMISTIIGFIDKAIPGQKTYALMLIAFLMMVCQIRPALAVWCAVLKVVGI